MRHQYPGYLDRPSFGDRDVTVGDDLGNLVRATCRAELAAADHRHR